MNNNTTIMRYFEDNGECHFLKFKRRVKPSEFGKEETVTFFNGVVVTLKFKTIGVSAEVDRPDYISEEFGLSYVKSAMAQFGLL